MTVIPSLVAVIGLLCLLAYAGYRIESLQRRLDAVNNRQHSTLIEAVGDKHEANVLRLAAIALASPDGQHQLRVLSHDWEPGDPPITTVWLNARARAAEERSRA